MPREDGAGPKGLGLEAGRGMGRSRGGRSRGDGFRVGPAGSCICPYCGTKIPHQIGFRCFEERCPKCGTTMRRE